MNLKLDELVGQERRRICLHRGAAQDQARPSRRWRFGEGKAKNKIKSAHFYR
jgi:hypothetical protein